jgi:hypothetical protein
VPVIRPARAATPSPGHSREAPHLRRNLDRDSVGELGWRAICRGGRLGKAAETALTKRILDPDDPELAPVWQVFAEQATAEASASTLHDQRIPQ